MLEPDIDSGDTGSSRQRLISAQGKTVTGSVSVLDEGINYDTIQKFTHKTLREEGNADRKSGKCR